MCVAILQHSRQSGRLPTLGSALRQNADEASGVLLARYASYGAGSVPSSVSLSVLLSSVLLPFCFYSLTPLISLAVSGFPRCRRLVGVDS